jgi:hypothetical protein
MASPEQARTVFLSYAKEDDHIARSIIRGLEGPHIRVWFAPHELSGGDNLPDRIVNGINASSFFFATVSRAANISRWVADERSTAVALANGGAPLLIVAIRLDDAAIPPLLASRKAIDLRPATYDHGLAQLLAIIKGERLVERSPMDEFDTFVASFVEVDHSLAEKIRSAQLMGNPRNGAKDWDSTTAAAAPATNDLGAGMALGEWAVIRQQVKESKLAEKDRDQILADIDAGLVPPCATTEERQEVRDWIRRADEELLALAGELYDMRRKNNQRFIGFDMIVRLLTAWRARGEAPSRSDADIRFRAEELAERARKCRLLIPFKDSEYSEPPSEGFRGFDHGPRVMDAGRLAMVYELHAAHRRRRAPVFWRLRSFGSDT